MERDTMSQRGDKERVSRLFAAVEALYNELETLTSAEVEIRLADAGVEPAALQVEMHNVAKAITERLRAEGKPAPPYLANLVGQTADATVLPPDPKAAVEKAARYLRSCFAPKASGTIEIVQSFRKGADALSSHDLETLAKLEEELRQKAGAGS